MSDTPRTEDIARRAAEKFLSWSRSNGGYIWKKGSDTDKAFQSIILAAITEAKGGREAELVEFAKEYSRAFNDPGAFTPRGADYTEPMGLWIHRAREIVKEHFGLSSAPQQVQTGGEKAVAVDMWDQEKGTEGTVSHAVRQLTTQWGLPPTVHDPTPPAVTQDVATPKGPFRIEGPHECNRSINDPTDVHWSLFDKDSGNIAHFDKKEHAKYFVDLINHLASANEALAQAREEMDWAVKGEQAVTAQKSELFKHISSLQKENEELRQTHDNMEVLAGELKEAVQTWDETCAIQRSLIVQLEKERDDLKAKNAEIEKALAGMIHHTHPERCWKVPSAIWEQARKALSQHGEMNGEK